jgi:hypothetical protein
MSKSKGGAQVKLVLLSVVALAGVAGLAAFIQNTGANKLPAEHANEKGRKILQDDQRKPAEVPAPKFTEGGELKLDGEPIAVPKGAEPKLFIVNAFLKKAAVTEEPVEAEKIEVDHGVAKVYLPESFAPNFGSQDEATFLLGLRSALGQFREIETIELYQGGQKLEELGHVEIGFPMPVIRPSDWGHPAKSSEEPKP